MTRRTVRIAMNGVTGRMGYRQHLVRSILAIREQGGNPFFDEQVPQAVIALKQGVGRLIRDDADFGVVMICDTRLVTKGYGRAFIQSLPPMKRTRELAEVQGFLRERLGEADSG